MLILIMLVVLIALTLINVPIAIALGFDKPQPGLMDRKPRPLKQPVLSRSQWVRLIFLGLLMCIATLTVEKWFEQSVSATVGATMAFAAFSLFNVALGLSCRSETRSAFNRDILSDRRQLGLYGLALLLTLLPTELGFLQRILGLTSLNFDQWLLCIGLAFALLVVDEVIKFFLRRSRGHAAAPATAPAAA